MGAGRSADGILQRGASGWVGGVGCGGDASQARRCDFLAPPGVEAWGILSCNRPEVYLDSLPESSKKHKLMGLSQSWQDPINCAPVVSQSAPKAP